MKAPGGSAARWNCNQAMSMPTSTPPRSASSVAAVRRLLKFPRKPSGWTHLAQREPHPGAGLLLFAAIRQGRGMADPNPWKSIRNSGKPRCLPGWGGLMQITPLGWSWWGTIRSTIRYARTSDSSACCGACGFLA